MGIVCLLMYVRTCIDRYCSHIHVQTCVGMNVLHVYVRNELFALVSTDTVRICMFTDVATYAYHLHVQTCVGMNVLHVYVSPEHIRTCIDPHASTSRNGKNIFISSCLQFLFIIWTLVRWYKHSSEQFPNIITWIDQNVNRCNVIMLNNNINNISSRIEHCSH